MKRIKSVNGYTIYEATSARDEANYNCRIGHYNLYLSSDIRDYGLSNSYPDWEDIDTMSEAIARAEGSQFAVATAMAWELSDSTIEDVALRDEIERRLEAGQPMDYICDHYDTENGCFILDWMDAQHSEPERYKLTVPAGKSAFYFTSSCNYFIAMVLVVDSDKLDEAKQACVDGLTSWYDDDDDALECWGETIEAFLDRRGISYEVLYPTREDDEGNPTETWESFASQFDTVIF